MVKTCVDADYLVTVINVVYRNLKLSRLLILRIFDSVRVNLTCAVTAPAPYGTVVTYSVYGLAAAAAADVNNLIETLNNYRS